MTTNENTEEQAEEVEPRGGVEFKWSNAQEAAVRDFYENLDYPFIHELVKNGYRAFGFEKPEDVRVRKNKTGDGVNVTWRGASRRMLVIKIDEENKAIMDRDGAVWIFVDPSTPTRAEEKAAKEEEESLLAPTKDDSNSDKD